MLYILSSALNRLLKPFLSLSQSIRGVFATCIVKENIKPVAAARIETVTMPGAGNRLSGSNIRDESTHRQR